MKYLVFDFDGTLVDSKAAFITIFNQLAEKHQFRKLEVAHLNTLRQMSIRERCEELQVPMYKIPLLAAEVYRKYQRALHNVHLFPGIKEMLQHLNNEGFQLAILSSNSEANIRAFLQHQEIDSISQVICSRYIFGKDKLLLRFLKTQKLSPAEVLYVGDEQRDMVACRQVRIKMIWVNWGYDAFELVQPLQPDFIAYQPGDIIAIAEGIKA
jgi:phosphoglycolate phosphatase